MARKKCFVIVGHSNAEGTAGSSPMIAVASWLNTKYNNTPTTPNIRESFYKNIKVFTSDLAWPGPAGTPPVSAIGSGAWLDMTTMVASSPLDAHPYASPWQYPNTRSIPVTPSRYQAITGEGGAAGGGSVIGVELPLAYHLAHHWGETAHMVKLAIPGSVLLRRDQGLTTLQPYAWWTPLDEFDWHPTTGRLFQAWLDKMTGAAAALTAPDKLDVQLIVSWMGDNDSNSASGRVTQFKEAYEAFIDKMRQACVDNDWTSLPKHKIPVAAMGIYPTYGVNVAAINSILQGLANNDPWMKWVSTTDLESLAAAGFTDPVLGPGGHISHNGYLEAAELIYEAFVTMQNEGEDALPVEGRISRSEARNRVLNYYERGRTRTDADPEFVNQHLNGALFHILNIVGDQAFWLRRIEAMSLSGGWNNPILLPKYVSRILRIEDPNDPGYEIKYDMLGHVSGGRIQIVLPGRVVTGTFNVHFISYPREMTKDEELVPLPYHLTEWLIVETCRRLARASGNVPLQNALYGEAQQLMKDSMRNMGAVQRARHDRLYSQRRMVTRRRRGGFGYFGSTRYP